MPLLYWFESIRMPFLDTFMSYVTYFGSEYLLILMGVLLFWCIDKKDGYYLLFTALTGTVINQTLKLCFRVPRPWVKDPSFTIVEAARADATGYSFPSGHTQAVCSTLGVPAMRAGHKLLRWLCFIFIALTAISRMYLGVHTPADVGVSLILGMALLIGSYPIFYGRKKETEQKRIYIALFSLVALSLLGLLFVELYNFPADIDEENFSHGLKNAYTMLGGSLGLLLTYHLDTRYIHFETKAKWWAQIIKIVLGVALVMLVRTVTKQPLLDLFNGSHIADGIRYFLMMAFAGCVWPLTFKWFSGKRAE